MIKTYPSKVSYGILILVFLVLYGPLVPRFLNVGLSKDFLITLSSVTLVFAFVLHLFLKTYYTIENDYLKIKCGFFSFKPIAINDIKEISKTRSLLSSPAPSLDRIKIKYRKFGKVIISPKDKHQFAEDLAAINPGIQYNLN